MRLVSATAFSMHSIRQARGRAKIARNVAELVTTPGGRAGRTSRALKLAQANAVLEATPREGRTAWSVDLGHRGPGATGRAAGP